MGNNCNTITKPTIRNLPSGATGDIARSYIEPSIPELDYAEATKSSDELISGFCAGTADTNVRRDYCSKVGNLEWEYKSSGESCHYSDCNKGYAQKTGCCGGCCGIVGKGVVCKRTKFTGNAISCCLNDYSGCGATSMPNDPRKYDLAFSSYEDGSPVNQNTTKGNTTSIIYPEYGWECSKSNCQNTCDPCQRNINSDGSTLVEDNSGRAGGTGTNKNMFRCDSFTRSTEVKNCRDILLEYCSGEDLDKDDDSWIYRWMNNDGTPLRYGCLNVLARNIYDTSEPLKPNSIQSGCDAVENYFASLSGIGCTPSNISDYNVNISGIKYATELMTKVANKYAENGYIIGSTPGSFGYNPFQDLMYSDICCKFPLVCQSFLKTSCSAYNSNQLASSVSISNWCGCYLPDSEYSKYVDSYQLNKECTPMCNRGSAIPIVSPTNEPRYCTGTNCIIDDLAIQLSNVDISGEINVTQMCGNCSGGQGSSCTCLISNNTINIVGGNFNQINTGETCTSTLCTALNPNTGFTETIPCEDVQNPNYYFKQQEIEQREIRQKQVRKRNIIILIIISVVILVVLVFYFLIRPNFNDISLPQLGVKIPKPLVKEEEIQSGNINTTESQDLENSDENIVGYSSIF